MKKMDRHKRRNHNKAPCSQPSSKFKLSYTEISSMSDEELTENCLINRELKLKQIMYGAPKSCNIVQHEIMPVGSLTAKRVISLESDMKLDEEALVRKSKKHVVQNYPIKTTTNGNNDRLVIELSDYLTLTKTKHVGKFKLKPITSKYDKGNSLSPIEKIIQTANAVKLEQVFNGEHLTQTKVDNSNQESQRTFLLVPQKTNDPDVNKISKVCQVQVITNKSKIQQSSKLKRPVKVLQNIERNDSKNTNTQLLVLQKIGEPDVNKKSKVCQEQIIKTKSKTQPTSKSNSPAKVLQNTDQNDHKTTSSRLSNVVAGPDNFFIKLPAANYQNSKTQLLKIPSSHITKVMKIQGSNVNSDTNNSTHFLKQKKKKLKVVLKAHPYFSQQEPFIIKHRPIEAKVVKHQSYSVKNQQGNLLNSEFNIVNICEPSKLIDEIKYEVPEQDINYLMSEESESINQVFPVALKSNDSDDFEYLMFENNEILTGNEMQILGI